MAGTVKVTFENGMILEASPTQVAEMAKLLKVRNPLDGDGIHYNSISRGVIKISDMTTEHIANALCKMYRNWAQDLSGLRNRDLLSALSNGPNNKTFMGLITEYAKRVNMSEYKPF